MSDRLAVFNQGRIEQIGPPAEVYEHPESEFIAGFVGVSNVLERDGRRYTVRPEKINLLMDGEEPRSPARTSRQGLVARRAVRRAGDALPRHARPGWRAAGARTEPRRRLERGARGERTPGVARVAPGTGVGDRTNRREDPNETKAHGGRGRRWACSWRALSVVAAGCGGGSDSSSREHGDRRPRLDARRDPGEREERGPGQSRHLGRLRRQVVGRPVHAGDRLQGEHEGRRQLRRHGRPRLDRRVRRRLRIGRRDAATHREGRRRAGELRPDPELRGRVRGPEGPVVQHGRRRRLRRAARPRRERHGLQQHGSSEGHRQLGADLARHRLQGQAVDLRQPDLHRRRRHLPEGDAAGPRASRIRTSSTRTSSTLRSTS